MPLFLLWGLLGTSVAGSAFLVVSSGIEETGESVSNAGNKLLVTAAGALGLYAAYKVIQKLK